jgi:hypothetical protein
MKVAAIAVTWKMEVRRETASLAPLVKALGRYSFINAIAIVA